VQVSASQQLVPAIFSRGPTSNADQVSDKVLEAPGTDESQARNEPQQLAVSTRKNAIAQALTADELSQLRLLKNRDREVRAHEQAHASVGGPYAGAPNYQYTKGPDGRQYASSGHVNIDSSKITGDPEATLQKALQLKRAALAPAQPSQQDRRVAVSAQQLVIEARADLNALLLDAQRSSNSTATGSTIDTFV
jgi:hypothetical protein